MAGVFIDIYWMCDKCILDIYTDTYWVCNGFILDIYIDVNWTHNVCTLHINWMYHYMLSKDEIM